MKKNITISQELAAIKAALVDFEQGASIEEIKAAAGFEDMELRTLQRRLAILKDRGEVRTSGDTRSTRYHLAYTEPLQVAEPEIKYERSAQIVPLSKASKQLIALISKPENQRKPVGYHREFLEGYQPNKDSYFTAAEKRKLEKIGKTNKANQPAGTYARDILNRLLIDLSWNSSRLEGNTYSLLDTERLISLGEAADEKSAMEAQMILNHKDAIEFIVQPGDDIGFNRYSILNLQALLSNNLLPNPAASGRLRQILVGIHRSVYTPLGLPQLIEEMFELILEKANQISDPFEQAFFVMVQLPYLQPFDDVNKRVSRLAANIPMVRHNLSPLSFMDVPNDLYIQGMLAIYEMNRVELLKDIFLWAYERSALRYSSVQQSLGEPDHFRLQYRQNIRSVVSDIVSNQLSRKAASAKIKTEAVNLPELDRAKFSEIVETELLSLHEGNFARYWIRPADFRAWQLAWRILETTANNM